MASNTYIAPFYSSLGCSSRPLFAANMLGLRSLCNRAITASRAKVKAPNRISSCKFEGVPQAFHRICSPSFRLPQQYTRSSIRSYSKDSVLVPAKSIEGFGGPTDEFHYTDEIEAACRKGILLKDAEDYDGAIDQFTKAIQLSDETSYRAYSLRADLHQTLGNLNEALADYTRVLKYLPTHVPTLTSEASVHKRLGNYEKALGQFNFILTFEGMYAPAWLGKAECHAQMGEHELAVPAFKKALEFKDRWVPAASVYEALGDSLIMTNNVEEALEAYRQSLSIFSGSPTCWAAFGVALYISRSFPEATDAFTQALNLGVSSKHDILVKRASCYLHFGNLDKALADCKASLVEAPSFYKAQLVLAQVHHQQENFKEAVEAYSSFISQAEGNVSDSAKFSTEAMSQHWNQLSDIFAKRAECYVELWALTLKNQGTDPEPILEQIVFDEAPLSHAQTIDRFEEVDGALTIMGNNPQGKFLKLAFDDLVSSRKKNMTQPAVPELLAIIRGILGYTPSVAGKSKPKVVSSSKKL